MSVIPRANGTTLVVGQLPLRDRLDRGFYRGVGDELIRIVVGRRGALGLYDLSRGEQRAHDAYAALAGDDELPAAMRIMETWRRSLNTDHLYNIQGKLPDDLLPFWGVALEKCCARYLGRIADTWYREQVQDWDAHIISRLILARYHQCAYRRTSFGPNSFVVHEGKASFKGSTERHDVYPGLHRSSLFMRVPAWEKWYTDIYRAGLSIVNGSLVSARITEGRTTLLVAGWQAPGYSITTRLLRQTTGPDQEWHWLGKEESNAIIYASLGTSARQLAA